MLLLDGFVLLKKRYLYQILFLVNSSPEEYGDVYCSCKCKKLYDQDSYINDQLNKLNKSSINRDKSNISYNNEYNILYSTLGLD